MTKMIPLEDAMEIGFLLAELYVDPEKVRIWFKTPQPLLPEGKSAQALIDEGRAKEVINVLRRFRDSTYG